MRRNGPHISLRAAMLVKNELHKMTEMLILLPVWYGMVWYGMVWYGMVSVDLCSAITTKVSNALNTLVSRRKPGFQALSKGLIVLLCAEVVRQALASTPPGMPGTHPPIFWLGGRQREYPPILLRTFGYSRRFLVALRSLSLKPFHSAIRRHQFASVRQADSRLTRLVPPNLELALTPLNSIQIRKK